MCEPGESVSSTILDVNAVQSHLKAWPALQAASESFRRSHPHLWNADGGVHFYLPAATLSLDMVTSFHGTSFLLVPMPSNDFGGQLHVSIRSKDILSEPPATCFHATPLRNESRIRILGLLTGYAAGVAPRSRNYADSQFFIYAATTENEARQWYCDRLGDSEPGVLIPIDIQRLACRLVCDPCSRGPTMTHGYILETAFVPPLFLGPSLPVHRIPSVLDGE